MAKKTIIDAITKLYSKLGGNLSDVLGTRSNVNFMGTGKSSEPFLDMDLNIDALGALSQSKAVNELKSSVGFATADKLNDIQATKLLTNMQKMDEFYNPPAAPANITDLGTGTKDLDAKGLESLRTKVLPDEEKSALMSRLDEIVKKKQADNVSSPFEDYRKNVLQEGGDLTPAAKTPFDEAVEYNPTPGETIQNLVDQKFGVGYFDNVGATPSKRGSAREFLVEALKKENPNQTTFADIVDAVDVRAITEGGGGAAGDPIALVDKYFGPRIVEMLPSGASSEEIAIFTQRILNNVVDANGLRPTDPRFDRMTARIIEDFARGGLAKILEV